MKPSCKILTPTTENLRRCARLLRNGEVVGLPTETVYGLAGNAFREATVRKIFEVKGRPFIDPLIVHFDSLESASRHAELGDQARRLAKRFWPGALTLVVRKQASIPDIVTAGLSSVAIRVPGHSVFRALLSQLEFPLAAPSANPFGYVSPTQAAHVEATLGGRIPIVLDGGPCRHGVESTIVDLRDPNHPKLLRPGPICAQALGIQEQDMETKISNGEAQAAPGMLTQHYSPHTQIKLFPHGDTPDSVDLSEAVLCNTRPETDSPPSNYFWLSESNKPEEVAHNLFTLLQKLDNSQYVRLHVELAINEGIGIAVNDRLKRAAAKCS
jgi:L-threonylcarbamoyladenylate synthase